VLGPWPVIQLGGIVLPTYYIIMSAVFLITTWYVYKRAERLQYSGTTAMDLYLVAIVCGAIGARLMHVFYEAPDYYAARPIEVLYFWQGGFVFYGGLIAGFFGGLIALRIKKQSFPMWLDFFTPILSLGYALGRFACFFAGCCYGKVCALPWAFPFKNVNPLTGATTIIYRHPTQLYAVGLELLLYALVVFVDRKKTFAREPGKLFVMWATIHALTRIFIEHFRADDRGPMLDGYSISVRISGFIIIAILFYYRVQRRHRPLRKPGV